MKEKKVVVMMMMIRKNGEKVPKNKHPHLVTIRVRSEIQHQL